MITKFKELKEKALAFYTFVTTGEYSTVKKVMAITTAVTALAIVVKILTFIF